MPHLVERVAVVGGVQRPRLPGHNVLGHGRRDPRDQVGRHVDAVQVLEVALNVPHRHPAGLHAEDLLVEAREAGLALLHEL